MIKFKVHSFVDVITNSSSELYVIDKDKIKENLQDIIESITLLANADEKLQDVFTVSIPYGNEEITIYGVEEKINEIRENMEYMGEEEIKEYKEKIRYYEENREKIDKIAKSLNIIFSFKYKYW